MYTIMSNANKGNFTSFKSLISFAFTLSRTFSTMLSRNGESQHLCLISNLGV